jgi:hypothetical protein
VIDSIQFLGLKGRKGGFNVKHFWLHIFHCMCNVPYQILFYFESHEKYIGSCIYFIIWFWHAAFFKNNNKKI